MWPAQGVSGGTWSGSISLQESFLRQRSYNSIERLGKSSTIWLVYTRGQGRERSLWDPVVVCVHHKYMQINAIEAVKGNSSEPHAGCKILLPEASQAGRLTQDHPVWKPWGCCWSSDSGKEGYLWVTSLWISLCAKISSWCPAAPADDSLSHLSAQSQILKDDSLASISYKIKVTILQKRVLVDQMLLYKLYLYIN